MLPGLKNKVLEALAMGLPCVCSSAAWSGTVIPQGEGILATDDPKRFAGYVIRLLRDGKWRAEMGTKARAAAEANYRWEAQLARLDRIVATIRQPNLGRGIAV